MKIYTKTGDNRKTSLLDGSRVKKSDPRISAVGDIDELNSTLAIIISFKPSRQVKEILEELQHTLFKVAADIVSPLSMKETERINEKDIKKIEKYIDEINKNLPEINEFVIPKPKKTTSFLHQARCVARRAEREIVKIEDINDEVLKYTNRISDLLFVLARFEDKD